MQIENTDLSSHSRPLPRGRAQISALVAASGDVIRIDDAVSLLQVSRVEAAKLLSRWTNQGWLRRVGSGAYVPAPIDSLASEHVLQDPWVLVPALFSPAYIGGRTAAEHWDLTEQTFNDIVVMTAQPVRVKSQIRHGAQFTLKHIQQSRIFATKVVWRGQTKVAVSDVHRTIVDMLDDPASGGGIQHVADCLANYLKRPDRDDGKLIQDAERLDNGAVFKRLGFLAERLPEGTPLIAPCHERLTTGNARLDPSLEASRLVSKWRLWIPTSWAVRKAGAGD
jgi:predicted transcriptional regulator of viral defense system